MSRLKKKRRNGLKLITFMVLIICVVVLYKTKEVKGVIDHYEVKIQKLNEQILEQESRSTLLAETKAYQSTTRYIEEIARTKLSLYYPDEIIFKEKQE